MEEEGLGLALGRAVPLALASFFFSYGVACQSKL